MTHDNMTQDNAELFEQCRYGSFTLDSGYDVYILLLRYSTLFIVPICPYCTIRLNNCMIIDIFYIHLFLIRVCCSMCFIVKFILHFYQHYFQLIRPQIIKLCVSCLRVWIPSIRLIVGLDYQRQRRKKVIEDEQRGNRRC